MKVKISFKSVCDSYWHFSRIFESVNQSKVTEIRFCFLKLAVKKTVIGRKQTGICSYTHKKRE